MKVQQLHSWQLSTSQAKQIQWKLAKLVLQKGKAINPRFIAGVDISAPDSRGIAHAAAVVLNYPELKLIEVKVAEDKLTLPYIPGLLSFRESPLILAVCQMLSNNPDIILVDGQGIAHPRRFGIASHLGLLLNMPTIGCAKSRLCGKHGELTDEAGSYAELTDKGEVIGAALRTKAGVNPIYVSIGHKLDLPSAIKWVINCCRGYRLPEPCRLAHLAAGGKLTAQNIKPNQSQQPMLFT